MSPQTAAGPIAAAGQVHHLKFARGATTRLLQEIPHEKLCAQTPSCSNHALWIIGHLATTDDYFVNEFAGGGLKLPEHWHKTFGMGSKPVADASAYPPVEEVRRAFEERRAALVCWFESLTPTELEKPLPESWAKYALAIGDLGPFIAWHEGYHCGQLATLRKSFGLAPAFG